MHQLIKYDKKTGKRYVINTPSWEDYQVNANMMATDTTSTVSPVFIRTSRGSLVSQVSSAELTMSNVTFSSGSSIIAMIGSPSSNIVVTSASWGAINLTLNKSQVGAAGASKMEIWSVHGVTEGTADFTVQLGGSYISKGIILTEVTGLTAMDVSASATNFTGAPSSGPTPTSSFANEYLCGFIYQNANTGSWGNSFEEGQMLPFVAINTPTFYEGFRIVDVTGSYTANRTLSAGTWNAVLVTYR